ncbi:MAG: hypothetical protein KAU52_03945 [Methanosarcinales archaeon]|nr:hypothetical protein [Methanosarcinales archaeon]
MKQTLKLTFAAMLILISIPAVSAETTASNGTLFVGVPVPLDADGLTAICKDISRDGNAAWIELEKDNEVQYSHILKQGDPIVHGSDSDSLTYRIDAIFHGTQTNMAKISVIDPSEIDLSALRTRPDSILLSMGERRNESDGTEIVHRIMGVNGDKAWIELEGDGMGQYSHIMTEDDPIVYKNNSDEWVAYRIDAIFRGIEHDMIELSPVDPPIDPSTIDFNYVEGLWDNFILDLGEPKDIGGGMTLRCTGIDLPDSVAWIELARDGEVLYSHILQEGECATYEHSGMLHCCEVHRVFTGIAGDFVEFSPVKISDIDVASVPDRSEYIMVGLGVPVELSGGAKLLCKQIDQDGEKVWIEIERNEYEKSEKVINRTHPFAYRVGDTEYVYDLEAVFLGEAKSAIEISFVGSSPVMGGDADVLNHTPTPVVPAFTASAAIVVLAVVYARRRRHG